MHLASGFPQRKTIERTNTAALQNTIYRRERWEE
jgi:hypothetical protein